MVPCMSLSVNLASKKYMSPFLRVGWGGKAVHTFKKGGKVDFFSPCGKKYKEEHAASHRVKEGS